MKDFIDFIELKNLFDPKDWDVAYVSASHFEVGGHKPIKSKNHLSGVDWVDNLEAIAYNGIILARYSEESNNYALYDESDEILSTRYKHNYGQVYVNFKEVSLLSGFAKRAKNSLVYNRKFGFQCKLCAYMFIPSIVNYEELEPSTELLDLCNGCDDCIKHCPVGAIHEDRIDRDKCDDFLTWGNDPNIPSMKWFWYEKIGHKKYSREEVESWSRDNLPPEYPLPWGKGIDGFYEANRGLHKDGEVISWPHCRECQLQPRCSKVPVPRLTL